MPKPRKRVRETFECQLVGGCSAVQCVLLPKCHINRYKFQQGDLVRVTVERIRGDKR